MLLVNFLLFGAYLAIWLGILAMLKYGFEGSLPGRLSGVLTG